MFKVDLKKVALPKLEAILDSLSSPDAPHWVEAGVLAGATNTVAIPNKKKPGLRKHEENVVKYARWNEYGTSDMPPRPFLQFTFAQKEEEWKETLMLALRRHIRSAKTDGGKVLELALSAAGRKMQSAIVRTIEDNTFIENSPAYKRWKEWYRNDDQGSPLTLTATLAKSIQYQLTTESGALYGKPSPMSKSKAKTPGSKKGKKGGKAKGGSK